MIIEKIAKQENAFKRNLRFYSSARNAFKAFLHELIPGADQSVLLPAYIGWSPQEGSGVFDPVLESKVPYDFYRMDRNLHIDLDDLRSKLKLANVKLLVLIHYFGYRDPAYEQAVALAHEHGVVVLEDQAHSFFNDMVYGSTGRLGDASIFSLHKMLPLPDGGILALPWETPWNAGFERSNAAPSDCFMYDLPSIAKRRRRNAEEIAEKLQPFHEEITPLRPQMQFGEVPQTFPVIINHVSRDGLYEIMNQAGYGVVSLYHKMIDQLSCELFPDSHRLSRRIMNLPVHQDMAFDQIAPMVETLLHSTDRLKFQKS